VRAVATSQRQPLPIVDLFAGAGGLSIGFRRAGLAPVAAVENDEDAAETYARQFDAELHVEDVNALLRTRLLRKLRHEVVAVVGGPPCQPWSQGGLGRGAKDPRDALPSFVEAVSQLKPPAFVLENSSGLDRGANKGRLTALARRLAALGYDVHSATLSAAEFGVPQNRRRLFVVGTRRPGFAFPVPTHGPGRGQPWVTAGQFVGKRPLGEPNDSPVTYAKNPHVRPDPYGGLLWNGGGRPIKLSRPAPTILASGGNKTLWVDCARIVPDYHAHLQQGGRPRKGVVEGARRLTVDEAARLQGFPAYTRFHGSTSSCFEQVGNAVPPPLAAAVARALSRWLREDFGVA